jgi:hypothetical protein
VAGRIVMEGIRMGGGVDPARQRGI